MFLESIRRRNPRLIEQAIALHQAGELPANAYVIDLDAVEVNARAIAAEAAKYRPDRAGHDQTDGPQGVLLSSGHARRRGEERSQSTWDARAPSIARAWRSGISATLTNPEA